MKSKRANSKHMSTFKFDAKRSNQSVPTSKSSRRMVYVTPAPAATATPGRNTTTAVEAVDPLHVLRCVSVVTRERPQVAALLHVNLLIDAFLYRSQYYTKSLEDAVADDNVHLLCRLLADVSCHADARGTSAAVQHPFFVGLQVTKAARLAVQQRSSLGNFQQLLSCLHTVDSEAVGASAVIEEAAATGDLELLQWLHVNCPVDPLAIVDSSQAAARAGGNGHVHVLEWLVTSSSRWSPQSRLPLADAVKNNRHEVLEWLDTHPQVHFSFGPSAFYDAAQRGDLTMLTWLSTHHSGDPERDEPVAHHAADGAAAGGHVNVLEWLFEHHRQESQCGVNGYVGAARNGHLAVFHWLYAHHPKRFWRDSMEVAAKAGHIDIVMFLHNERDENDFVGANAAGARLDVIQFLYEHYHLPSVRVVQRAAANGSLDIIQWLQETQGQDVTYANSFNLAVLNDHTHVLEFMFRHVNDRDVTWVIDSAAQSNNIRLMQWLHTKVQELRSTLVDPPQGLARWMYSTEGPSLPVDYAARNGNLKMIQWLEANGYGECTTSAMDWAAEGGHLDVLQYLHETRNEGCTTSAMDLAAANGNLTVVQWLHVNRTEGCTTDAVDLAVHNGHAKVVEFLLTNRSEGCTRAAVESAVETRGDAAMVHLLFVFRREMVDVESVRAHADGNKTMRRWLRRVGDSSRVV